MAAQRAAHMLHHVHREQFGGSPLQNGTSEFCWMPVLVSCWFHPPSSTRAVLTDVPSCCCFFFIEDPQGSPELAYNRWGFLSNTVGYPPTVERGLTAASGFFPLALNSYPAAHSLRSKALLTHSPSLPPSTPPAFPVPLPSPLRSETPASA